MIQVEGTLGHMNACIQNVVLKHNICDYILMTLTSLRVDGLICSYGFSTIIVVFYVLG